jgi:hypothetical protein
MKQIRDDKRQYWRLMNVVGGKFKLCTGFYRNKHLDVVCEDKTTSYLADAGIFTGQFWSLTRCYDGTYKLTNDYSGPNLHLEVHNDTYEAFLGTGDCTGQHWHITPIWRVVG